MFVRKHIALPAMRALQFQQTWQILQVLIISGFHSKKD